MDDVVTDFMATMSLRCHLPRPFSATSYFSSNASIYARIRQATLLHSRDFHDM